MDAISQSTKGLGRIEINGNLPFHDIPLDDFVAWHKRLLLPDDYEIECIQKVTSLIGAYDGGWQIYVHHEAIPADYEHVDVIPHYYMRTDTNGIQTPFLMRVEIRDGKTWDVLAITDKNMEFAL